MKTRYLVLLMQSLFLATAPSIIIIIYSLFFSSVPIIALLRSFIALLIKKTFFFSELSAFFFLLFVQHIKLTFYAFPKQVGEGSRKELKAENKFFNRIFCTLCALCHTRKNNKLFYISFFSAFFFCYNNFCSVIYFVLPTYQKSTPPNNKAGFFTVSVSNFKQKKEEFMCLLCFTEICFCQLPIPFQAETIERNKKNIYNNIGSAVCG